MILRSSLHFLSLRSSSAMQLFPPFHNQDSKTEIWAALFCHLSFFHFKSQQPFFPRWSIHNLMKSWGTGAQDYSVLESHIDMTSSPTSKLLWGIPRDRNKSTFSYEMVISITCRDRDFFVALDPAVSERGGSGQSYSEACVGIIYFAATFCCSLYFTIIL